MRYVSTVPSPAMFVGDDEFAGSPAPVNRALFLEEPEEWVLLFEHPKMRVEVGGPHAREFYGRFLATVRFSCPQKGIWFRLPFYRSSGRATPDRSPKGIWWPSGGIVTSAYAEESGAREGYILKEFWSLLEERWYSHRKRRENLPHPLQRVCDALAGNL